MVGLGFVVAITAQKFKISKLILHTFYTIRSQFKMNEKDIQEMATSIDIKSFSRCDWVFLLWKENKSKFC